MTLRKIAIDSSSRYVSKDNHSHSEQTLPILKVREIVNQTRERKTLPIKIFHKRIKKSVES